ncbi:MAG TPA: type IX secretion system membrane protein PorP/SprF [Phnomibacter sp.]|nr:type IX secretion system membrane protein PorP/SprF [Phnomibacter sp.]
MKRFVCGLLLLNLANWALAQQRPHYTQYILNNYIINPAVAGIENYTDIKISHRHQWVGLQDEPVTTYATIHGSIGKDDTKSNPTTFLPEGENPRGRAYWEEYTSAKPHHGWGVSIINDRTGPLSRFSAYGTYAYHLGIGPRTSISGGISLGVINNSLNTSKLIFDNPVDPAVAASGTLNTLRPDINAGIWLYSANFFAGISAQQIIDQGLEFSDNTLTTGNKTYPHLFGTFGYKFYAGQTFSIIPSVVFRYVEPLPFGVDFNVKAQYLDRFWFGAGYRVEDGVSAMVGVNVSNIFNVGYAFDYTTSRLQNFTKGTHEIVLGFMLGNKWGDLCPRNLW